MSLPPDTTTSRRVWYILVDSRGDPYKGIEVTSVSLSSDTIVDDFKTVVKSRNTNDIGFISAAKLKIYKSVEDFKRGGDSIEPFSTLDNYGTDGKENALAVVVREDVDENSKLVSLYKGFDNLNLGPYAAMEQVQQRMKQLAPPSEFAKPTTFFSESVRQHHKILVNRPSSRSGIPIEITCQEFAKFIPNSDSVSVTWTDVQNVLRLCIAMSDTYPLEQVREASVYSILQAILGVDIGVTKTVRMGKAKIDGSVVLDGRVLMIIETKNEWVGNSSDATLQSVGAYAHYVANNVGTGGVWPCFLLNIVGPTLSIHGAVMSPTITSYPLTDQLFCLDRSTSYHTYAERIAKILVALRLGIKDLRYYYKNQPKAELVSSHFWSIETGSSTMMLSNFRPMEEYFIDGVRKLLFFARTDTGQDVFVKFTKVSPYPEEFHNYCARKGYAPVLHGTKSSVCGRWTMVVMELLTEFEPLSCCTDKNTRLLVRNKVMPIVSEFHAAGFVHGDLRDANIMYKKEGDDCIVSIIDFDFGGQEGVARYSLFLNTTLDWPEGVVPGGIVKKEHDIDCVGKL